MVRTRASSFAVIAAVVLGLGVVACKKKDEKAGAPADKTAEQKGGNAVTKPALMVGGDDLSLLPSDSDVVLGLNFEQLSKSALWKQYSPKLMEKAAAGLADFKAMCGFDPIEKFKSVSMGLKGVDGGGKTPEGAVVVHGLEKAQTMGCLEKGKAKLAEKGSEVTIDGDMFTIKSKGGETTAFTFINNDTMFGVMGPTASKDTLIAAAKGTAGLKSSQTFTEMYSKIDTKQSLWFLVNGNASFMQKASLPGAKPKAIFGSLNVSDGLTLDVRMRMASPDEAKAFVDMSKGQTSSPQVKQMLDKLEVTQDAADAKISVAMSQKKLENLLAMVGGMMGGMMGGGGMGGP